MRCYFLTLSTCQWYPIEIQGKQTLSRHEKSLSVQHVLTQSTRMKHASDRNRLKERVRLGCTDTQTHSASPTTAGNGYFVMMLYQRVRTFTF